MMEKLVNATVLRDSEKGILLRITMDRPAPVLEEEWFPKSAVFVEEDINGVPIPGGDIYAETWILIKVQEKHHDYVLTDNKEKY